MNDPAYRQSRIIIICLATTSITVLSLGFYSQVNQTIKCVVVGDGACDKRELLISYTTNKFPQEYVPTVFDNYAVTIMIGGEPYTLGLYDIAGQADYDRLSPLSYPQTDVFIVLFTVASPASFENIRDKWIPEVVHHCPKVPFLLVANNIHRRTDPEVIQHLKRVKQSIVSPEEGKVIAESMGAWMYCECSPLTREGLNDVFDYAILAALGKENFKYIISRCYN